MNLGYPAQHLFSLSNSLTSKASHSARLTQSPPGAQQLTALLPSLLYLWPLEHSARFCLWVPNAPFLPLERRSFHRFASTLSPLQALYHLWDPLCLDPRLLVCFSSLFPCFYFPFLPLFFCFSFSPSHLSTSSWRIPLGLFQEGFLFR